MKKLLIVLMLISSISLLGCSNSKSTNTTSATLLSKKPTTQVQQTTQTPTDISNQSQNSQTANISYYFSQAKQNPDKELIKVIDLANKTLDIAIYSLTKKEIVNAIVNAEKRNVVVRIITDKIESKSKSESVELDLLSSAKIPIKVNNHSGLMHMKITIADNKICTTGSYNYTQGATTLNDEVFVVINNSDVATNFDKEFVTMWNDSGRFVDYN